VTDYLDRLVTRSFGLPGGVGPRLPSAYEADVAVDEPLIEVREESATRPSLASQPARTPNPPTPRRENAGAPAPRRGAARRPETEATPTAAPREASPKTPTRASRRPARGLSSPEADPTPPSNTVLLVGQPGEPEGMAAGLLAAPLAPDEPMPEEPARPAVPSVFAGPTSRHAEIRPALPVEVAVPRAGAALNAQPRAQPSAVPAVRITIGRIDVRAVTPPEPARARTPTTPPPLSLDDYLERRRGGRS